MAKDSRVKSLFPTAWHREETESVNVQPFVIASKRSKGQCIHSYKQPFQEIRGVSHRYSQTREPQRSLRAISLSHISRRPRERKVHLKKTCVYWLFSNKVNPIKSTKAHLVLGEPNVLGSRGRERERERLIGLTGSHLD